MKPEIAKRQTENFSHSNIKFIKNNATPRVSSGSMYNVSSGDRDWSRYIVLGVALLLLLLFATGRVFA